MKDVDLRDSAAANVQHAKELRELLYIGTDDSLMMLDLKPEIHRDQVRALLEQILPTRFVVDKGALHRRESLLGTAGAKAALNGMNF